VKKTPMAEFCPKVSLTTTGSAFCDAVEKRTRGATRVRPIMGANPKREPRRWQASSAECSFLHRKSRVGHRSHCLSFVDPVWQGVESRRELEYAIWKDPYHARDPPPMRPPSIWHYVCVVFSEKRKTMVASRTVLRG